MTELGKIYTPNGNFQAIHAHSFLLVILLLATVKRSSFSIINSLVKSMQSPHSCQPILPKSGVVCNKITSNNLQASV